MAEIMERLQQNGQSGQFERQADGAGVGAWSSIEKVQLQPLDYQTRIGPLFEAGCIAGARGLFAVACGCGLIIAGAGLGSAVGAPLPSALVAPGVGLSLFAGLGVGLYTLQDKLGETFEAYRKREVSRETYKRETQAAAAQTSERLTVEVIERPATNNGAGRIVYDALGTDAATLALAVKADSVSKSAFIRQGVPERKALDLIARIVALGYATASTGNTAGQWTAKGAALRRVLAGVVGDSDHDGEADHDKEGGEQ